jgi:hypothetical protein
MLLALRSSIILLIAAFSSTDIPDFSASAFIAAVSVLIWLTLSHNASFNILIASASSFHCDAATALAEAHSAGFAPSGALAGTVGGSGFVSGAGAGLFSSGLTGAGVAGAGGVPTGGSGSVLIGAG